MRTAHIFSLILLVCLLFVSCRDEYEILPSEKIVVSLPEYTSIDGFYLLNEGNMGMNKATLDYYDYKTGTYRRNIFGEANPTVIKELGDVGNDLKIYGNKLYVVVNCSNKIDVLDARTAVKLGQIDILNCRYINFHGAYAYVTSYDCPVQVNSIYEHNGYVAKIDTATLEVVDKCYVGQQPDELEIVGNNIYVANSGGYHKPHYDNTISVIDVSTFEETHRIEIAKNCYRLRVDSYAQLWISTRGDYNTQKPLLYCLDLATEQVVDCLDISVSDLCLSGDSLYIINTDWISGEVNYSIVDVEKRKLVSTNFITDGTDKIIRKPYGVLVNPITKDFYIPDAKNLLSPGTLYCFDKEGRQKWNVRTGDIPAHFAILGEYK
ncbi:YncE family protein [Bacteroidales bacterium OttesenSCG-928-M11]|nr:YncE family protein [Bacteroidales bacterium OttesenSCG-928-M11]